MVKNNINETLIEALSYCSVKELPSKLEGKEVWIKAIGLVSKADGGRSYVALVRGDNGKPRIVKDFGSLSTVVKVEEIYPYMYLSKDAVPTFEKEDIEGRIEWIKTHSEDVNVEELEGKTASQLNKIIISECAKRAISKDNANRRAW